MGDWEKSVGGAQREHGDEIWMVHVWVNIIGIIDFKL